MTIAAGTGASSARLVFAGLIALAVSACAAPASNWAGAYHAGNRARSGAQAAPARTDAAARSAPVDPVKAIGDALEDRMVIMIGSAQYGIFATY